MHLRHPVTQAVLDHAGARSDGWHSACSHNRCSRHNGTCPSPGCSRRRSPSRDSTASARRAAFGGVVEDNIENDFEAGAMERLHHVPKFVEDCERVLLRAVRLMRREERNGLHSPSSSSCPAGSPARSNWNTGSSSTAVTPRSLRYGIFSISPAYVPRFFGRDARAGMASKAAHMQLVNDGLGKGPLERQIAFPIVPVGIGDDAFHRHGGVVAGPRRSPAVVCLGHGHGKPVRVEQHLLGVEPKSAVRVERSREPDTRTPGLAEGPAQRHASSDTCDACRHREG